MVGDRNIVEGSMSVFWTFHPHVGRPVLPLLFTLYVNDFPGYVDNAVDLYADDSTLQAHAKEKLLQIN